MIGAASVFDVKIRKMSTILRVTASSRCLLYFHPLWLDLKYRRSKVMCSCAFITIRNVQVVKNYLVDNSVSVIDGKTGHSMVYRYIYNALPLTTFANIVY